MSDPVKKPPVDADWTPVSTPLPSFCFRPWWLWRSRYRVPAQAGLPQDALSEILELEGGSSVYASDVPAAKRMITIPIQPLSAALFLKLESPMQTGGLAWQITRSISGAYFGMRTVRFLSIDEVHTHGTAYDSIARHTKDPGTTMQCLCHCARDGSVPAFSLC